MYIEYNEHTEHNEHNEHNEHTMHRRRNTLLTCNVSVRRSCSVTTAPSNRKTTSSLSSLSSFLKYAAAVSS